MAERCVWTVYALSADGQFNWVVQNFSTRDAAERKAKQEIAEGKGDRKVRSRVISDGRDYYRQALERIASMPGASPVGHACAEIAAAALHENRKKEENG